MADPNIVLAVNSALHREIDEIIVKSAVSFANRRESGASASMNGALDYTAMTVIEAVRKHLGIEGPTPFVSPGEATR